MHISRVDLNLFIVLDTIYSEGGITKAAEKLHLSQPATSHALSRLRDMLGDPLFHRHGNLMVPTPYTRTIITHVRDGIRQFEITLRETNNFNPAETKKTFRIGMRAALEAITLPGFMEYVTQKAPLVDISVVLSNRRTLEADLRSGKLDVAVDMKVPTSDEIVKSRVATHDYIVIARSNHPCILNGVLTMNTYLAQEHILVTTRKQGLGLEDIPLAEQNLARRIRLRCTNFLTACEVVSKTDLLLTVPRHSVVFSRELGIQIIPFSLVPPADVFLYWHRDTDADPANAWLRNTVSESSRNGPAVRHRAEIS